MQPRSGGRGNVIFPFDLRTHWKLFQNAAHFANFCSHFAMRSARRPQGDGYSGAQTWRLCSETRREIFALLHQFFRHNAAQRLEKFRVTRRSLFAIPRLITVRSSRWICSVETPLSSLRSKSCSFGQATDRLTR